MKRTEFNSLPFGLYRVHWKSGGTSLAALGNTSNGDRWLAPCNWVIPNGTNDGHAAAGAHYKKLHKEIKKMELLVGIE